MTTARVRDLTTRRAFFASVVVALALLTVSCSDGEQPAAPSTSPTSQVDDSTTTTSSTDSSTSTSQSQARQPDRITDRLRQGALLGLSTGLTRAERAPRFEMLESVSGRMYDIGHVFHSWDTAIPTDDALMHLADGRTLMISWNGTDTIEISNGVHDEWIRSQARSVRDLGEPVLLRWLWEMDGRRRIAWVHSGPDYVNAWNRVRDIFDEEGATNAEFVWCPNEALFWDGGDPSPWYPGDDRVDWLCADGYNWGVSADSAEWLGLEAIFGDFYDWAVGRGLPILIGESGVGEAEPGAKAQWILDIPRVLETRFPEIDAFVYFDKDFTFQGHRDWRVDTSPETLDAWVQISRDPWFN